MSGVHVEPPDPQRASAWDERYASAPQVWSGTANEALVREAGQLPPGRALDVGCGEGADAIWLAQHGWDVTALDVSEVAMQRTGSAADAAGVTVQPLHADLVEAALPPGGFDLVSVQYPALVRTPGRDAERALLAAVAPGGVLLVVHHADMDLEHARAHGFDPSEYVAHEDLLRLLGDGWEVEVAERRPRAPRGGSGAHHHDDLVLRARRSSLASGLDG